MSIRVAAVVVVASVLALAGCTTAPDAAPSAATTTGTTAPAPEPEPRPTAVVDVPVTTASLDALPAAVRVPPVTLTIPALGVVVPIDPVGVRPDGQMEIPPLAERAGWYRYGAAPGEPEGTAVVAAHVDSVASAGLGPFARLRDLAAGDVVEVALQDGAVRRYVVTAVRSVPKSEVPWRDVFTRDGGPRLVMITCGGSFQRAISSYTDNVIVTADAVGA